MSDGPQRLLFNYYSGPADAPGAVGLFSDDPPVLLTAGASFRRNRRQRERLPFTALPVPDPVFGASLEWAYREYIVHRLAPGGDHGPVGDLPSRLVEGDARRRQLAAADPLNPGPGAPICLFSVIVAMEWAPGGRTLQQLEWAFRRASDFLYDVSDGYMAIGQVVVGGPALMGCADIQLLASNRLHPRSWVSGLHDERKYTPIRLGRGVWQKQNHVSIPWDEPEGYRTLIHEWAHYALELRDQYLEPRRAAASGDARRGAAETGEVTVYVPRISISTESIMGSLEGTSELVPQLDEPSGAERKRNIWAEVRRNGRFPFLQLDVERPPLVGPGRLPLPLPRFHFLGVPTPDGEPEELLLPLPEQMDLDHCWVYVLRGDPAAPTALVAQGTIDARARAEGFRLLGAREGDRVVLVGSRPGDPRLAVLSARIGRAIGRGVERLADIESWQWETSYAPAEPPLIEVRPDPQGLREDVVFRVSVEVAPAADRVWLFPLGGGGPIDATGGEALAVPALDGHVLARWGDRFVICPFSQGGGPRTNTPVGPPPISAGSSEGNLMLFFQDNQPDEDHSHVRVVTTMLPWLETPPGLEPRSYAFCLAATVQLPVACNPTLVLYYDRAGQLDGELRVCRLVEGAWRPVPTFETQGFAFVAAALHDPAVGGSLTAPDVRERVEFYRLCLVRRDASGEGGAEQQLAP